MKILDILLPIFLFPPPQDLKAGGWFWKNIYPWTANAIWSKPMYIGMSDLQRYIFEIKNWQNSTPF